MLSWFRNIPENTSAEALYQRIDTLEHHVPIYRGIVDVTSDEECAQVVDHCNRMVIDGELTYMWIISDSTHATKGGKVTLSNSWRDLLEKKEECGASIGDLLICFMPGPYEKIFKIISIYEAEAASENYCGNEGLMSVWDKTQVNKIPSLEYIWNYLCQTRNESDANKCIYSGIYPYVTTNIPTEEWGTIQTNATKDKDSSGYYSVTQFFYYRGASNPYIDTVWTRIIFYKDDGTIETGDWKAVSNSDDHIPASFLKIKSTKGTSIKVDGVVTEIPANKVMKINFSSSLNLCLDSDYDSLSSISVGVHINEYLPLENFVFTKYCESEDDYCSVNIHKLDGVMLDTSTVTDMSYRFAYQHYLKELNTTYWDLSTVFNMSNVFLDCSSLQALDTIYWDLHNVHDMSSAFQFCSSLQTLDTSFWDVSKVTNMRWMFYDCTNLKELEVSNWNTANVTDMSDLFYNCENLSIFNVTNWKLPKVTNMSRAFCNCASFDDILYVGGLGFI